MSTQPEALRLADLIHCGDDKCQCSFNLAAAKLRLLHAELQRCKQVCDATAEGWRADAEQWKAERDALLDVLKQIAGAAQRVDNLMSDMSCLRLRPYQMQLSRKEGK